MNAIEIITVIALIAYAVYKQTHVAEVKAKGRFTMALIYALVGIGVGGFVAPHGAASLALLAGSILLSVVVGVARGRLTRIWTTADGHILRQGTALTVGLFLGMIAVKFAMGTYAYLAHITDSSGFAEIMVMMAIMVAVQAEMIHRRALALRDTTPVTVPVPA